MPDYQTSRLETPHPLQYQRPAESMWSNAPEIRATCVYCRWLGLLWTVPLAIAAVTIWRVGVSEGKLEFCFALLLYVITPLQFLAAYWISACMIRRGRRGAILVALIYNYAAMAYAGACTSLSLFALGLGGMQAGVLVLALTLLLAWLVSMVAAAVGLHRARRSASMYG